MYHLIPAIPKSADKLWSVAIAESRDPQTWRKVAELLTASGAQSKVIAAPVAIVISSQFHLFYQTYGKGRNDEICHAVSCDGVAFTRNACNPIFHPTGAWNAGRAIDAEGVLWRRSALLYDATCDPRWSARRSASPLPPRRLRLFAQHMDGPRSRRSLLAFPLFYQGNNTNGKTWSIARRRIDSKSGRPVLSLN